MDTPAALIAICPPSANVLLDRARCETDDGMLVEIARSDYGYMADEMMPELVRIRNCGFAGTAVRGQLVEVLELTAFCDPDVPDLPPFERGPTGRRGHQARLFACAVLLRAAAEAGSERLQAGHDLALAHCLASAKVLGEGWSEAAACVLTWRLSRKERCYEPLLFALGLLVIATRLRSGRLDEPELGSVAEWVLSLEAAQRQEFPTSPADPKPRPYSVQSGAWQPMAAELMTESEAVRARDIRTNLQLCAILLDPGSSGGQPKERA
jgi:hypothetical protein